MARLLVFIAVAFIIGSSAGCQQRNEKPVSDKHADDIEPGILETASVSFELVNRSGVTLRQVSVTFEDSPLTPIETDEFANDSTTGYSTETSTITPIRISVSYSGPRDQQPRLATLDLRNIVERDHFRDGDIVRFVIDSYLNASVWHSKSL